VARPDWFDTPLDEWQQNFENKTLAPVRLIRALVPAMRERGWGRIIQISSRNAISPHAQFPGYGAAKAALHNLTLSLSKGLAGTGVTSNGIMPGLSRYAARAAVSVAPGGSPHAQLRQRS
jgi:NAD(P)-dependent dehydrogenase (short-subunit alcohol dehydrogenase family)